MGSGLTKALEGEGVDVEERHRGGPEDVDDSRGYVEHYLVENHG